MTKKLTKNDSMSKRCRDFDVIVALFEAFLKEKISHRIYFEEWEKAKNYQGTANVFYAWREWAKDINPEAWIMSAYVWRDSRRGYHFWALINREWIAWLSQNPKK